MKYAFYAGILFYNSILSLGYDIIGKERYIEYIRNCWISGWFSVPTAILGLIVSLYLIAYAQRSRALKIRISKEPFEDDTTNGNM